MGRNRVLSFISSQFSAPHFKDSRAPTPAASPPNGPVHNPHPQLDLNSDSFNASTPSPRPFNSGEPSPPATGPTSPTSGEHAPSPVSLNNEAPSSPTRHNRSNPPSMVQTHQPPVMDANDDTPPELQPIFNLLNSHTNKLYQEGYFLKLDDQDIKGKPNLDRTWTECFAQLVGTVLSLWDAAELDAAGEDGEVLPKFINLTDASIKMIESLPTRSTDEQPLQNILSISTAGRNRYLLHFNSHHSLVQWTSGIRLAMYEHSTLQEAYSGALIAGKGKVLNNINIIMERARMPVQEWVRVRFGAGVPWRRCWCVIEPPNEKEYQKVQKEFKKKNPYDRSHAPILKGSIKFYDTKKDAEKKKKKGALPIASITDAYSAYALYPQSRTLIDGSTLLKIEGNITIHSDPPSATEGFVFVMPEVPPAVSGFEMLLRFLFPTWDTFGLYGRPGRIVASVLDERSLMFAMPKHKRYGYLEILDVSGLITTEGSSAWSERTWRKKMKELTGQRMTAMEEGGKSHSRSGSRSSKRLSFGPQSGAARPRVNFADDGASVRSSRSLSLSQPGPRTDSAPPDPHREHAPPAMGTHSRHSRNISDTQLAGALSSHGLDGPGGASPAMRAPERAKTFATDLAVTPERVSSEDDLPGREAPPKSINDMPRLQTPEPVNAPPAFAHGAGSRPQQKPYHSPEMRRATSRLSSTTLSQLANAGGLTPDLLADDPFEGPATSLQTDPRGPSVQPQASANTVGMNANLNGSREGLTSPTNMPVRLSPGLPPPSQQQSKSPLPSYPTGPPGDPSAQGRSGPHMGPPPNNRGAPPMMSPRGPPPDGWVPPSGPPRDHRMGPPPNQGPPSGYQSYQQRGPPPGQRRTPPPNQGMYRPPQPISPPVNRKPLPQRTTSLQRRPDDGVSPLSPQSPGSGGFVQQAGRPPLPPQHPSRQNSERSAASSRYDDASSTASPDYASTRKSSDTQESVDRPRAGVLKTIGDDSAASSAGSHGTSKGEYDIPEINFGRTINYGAPALPLNAIQNSNELSSSTQLQRPFSPTTGNKSPGPGPGLSHLRQDSDDTVRRTVAWQPGTAVSSSTDNVVSPEQFVQQRAAATTTPMFSHQRNPSANTLTEFRAGTPTSPLKRPSSHGGAHSRHNSADLLQSGRPNSQGTAAALSTGEVSSHLSAREQEHVARITGSPLIALSGNRAPGGQQQSGYVGVIEARQREKAQMKQGIGGQAVAQAIDQRQREQSQQAQRAAQVAYAQQQAQFSGHQGHPGPQGSGMMGGGGGMNARSMSPGPGMMGMGSQAHLAQGFQPNPNYGPQPPRPQQQGGPAGQAYPQGAGWMGPNMQNRPPPPQPQPGFAMQGVPPPSPGFQMPPQGQYSPGTSGRPGTPGRMPFQGNAF